jgi:hypothetical protein
MRSKVVQYYKARHIISHDSRLLSIPVSSSISLFIAKYGSGIELAISLSNNLLMLPFRVIGFPIVGSGPVICPFKSTVYEVCTCAIGAILCHMLNSPFVWWIQYDRTIARNAGFIRCKYSSILNYDLIIVDIGHNNRSRSRC